MLNNLLTNLRTSLQTPSKNTEMHSEWFRLRQKHVHLSNIDFHDLVSKNIMDYEHPWFEVLWGKNPAYHDIADPEEWVHELKCERRFKRLDKPMKVKDVCCPICNGTRGCALPSGGALNAGEKAFWCLRPHCFFMKLNDIKVDRYTTKSTPPGQLFGLPPLFSDVSFSTGIFSPELKEQIEKALRQRSFTLIFSGPSGTGKTFAGVCILKHLMDSRQSAGAFYNFSTLYQDWLKPGAYIFDKMKNVPFLLIDDIGIRAPSPAFLDFLYALINYRQEHLLTTIFTTNLTSEQVLQQFNQQILSRLLSGYVIKMKGEDKRLD